MAQMRFKGAEAAYVTPLDRTVEPDEAVDVDDVLVFRAPETDDDGNVTDEGNPTGYAWPETLWEPLGSRRASKAAASKSDDDTPKEK